MKKNKLYTVNEWNQPAFMPKNRFDWGGLAAADRRANPWNYVDDEDITQQYMNSKNIFGISKADNPFSKGNLAGGIGAMAKTPIGSSLIGGLAGTVGKIGGNLISGGLQSKVGNAIGSIGGTVGSVLSAVNPVLGGIVNMGSKLIGGAVNGLFGTKVDEAKLEAANEGTAAYNNFQSNASSLDDVKGPTAQANVQNAYKGGLFSSGSARKKNEALKRARAEAKQLAFRSVDNNINNLVDDQINNALANYSAFGGPIETGDMGAIDYGFMSDYLTQKRRENDMKSKMSGIVPMPAFMPNSFAIGGDLQTNGRNYSVGKIYDVSEKEANRLKAMGYEFTVVG